MNAKAWSSFDAQYYASRDDFVIDCGNNLVMFRDAVYWAHARKYPCVVKFATLNTSSMLAWVKSVEGRFKTPPGEFSYKVVGGDLHVELHVKD